MLFSGKISGVPKLLTMIYVSCTVCMYTIIYYIPVVLRMSIYFLKHTFYSTCSFNYNFFLSFCLIHSLRKALMVNSDTVKLHVCYSQKSK